MKAEITAISEELGTKASEQAARMVRQETRLNNFERVIQTDQGVDPLSGRPFKMTRGSTVYKDYRDKLATVLARAKSDGWCGLTLDRCLHLIAEASGRTPPVQTSRRQDFSMIYFLPASRQLLRGRPRGRRCRSCGD